MSNLIPSVFSVLNNFRGRFDNKTSFNVNDLMSEINIRGGVYRPTLWLLEIQPPAWVKDKSVARMLPFFAQSANIPGVSVIPADVRRQGYGPMDRRPVNISMPDFSPSIMMDNEGVVLTFFQSWMNNVINFNTRLGEQQEQDGAFPFEVHYQDRYATTISLKTFDPQDNVIHTQTLYEAWPYQIGEVPLNYGNTNTVAELQTGFYFRTWSSRSEKFNSDAGSLLDTSSGDYGTEGGETEGGGRSLSTSERLLRIATGALAVHTAFGKSSNNIGDIINKGSSLMLIKNAIGI